MADIDIDLEGLKAEMGRLMALPVPPEAGDGHALRRWLESSAAIHGMACVLMCHPSHPPFWQGFVPEPCRVWHEPMPAAWAAVCGGKGA